MEKKPQTSELTKRTIMAPAFQAKKRKILDQLSAPESSYNDLSPKGSVDEGIRDLVHEINRMDDYVTTSSCAGRVAVFLEGATKSTNASSSLDHDRAIDSTPTLSSQTGKGGGRWLFVSHHPVDLAKYSTGGSLLSLLGLGTDSKTDFPPAGCRSQFIHFKFEPMVCSSPSSFSKPLSDVIVLFSHSVRRFFTFSLHLCQAHKTLTPPR